jgi:hypothetical protein
MAKTYDFSDFDAPAAQYDFSDFDSTPAVPQLESGLRGAAQGASLGFADEITGGLEALLTDKSYEQARDESRANYKAAQEANPITYGASEFGGGVATALVPGLNAGKLATLGGRVAANAGLGALAGAGMSEADNAGTLAKDAAMGGALAGGLSYGLEKAAPYAKQGAKYIGQKLSDGSDEIVKKIGKIGFGVDEKATANYLANRANVNNANNLGDIAESVLNPSDNSSVLREMRQKASDMSSNAWNTLSENAGMEKADLINSIRKAQEGLQIKGNIIGDTQQKAFSSLDNLANQFGKLDDNIDEKTLKSIIQNLDANINWQNPEMGPTNDAIKGVRQYIDQTLKSNNPAYKSAMEKTADVTQATKEVQKVFQNRSQPENYDKFTKQVKNLVNKDDMSAASQAVDKIQEHTGYNLRKDITDAWTKAQFEKGDVNGSRKTLIGGAIGTGVGALLGQPTIGAAVGSSAGFAADRYAGPIFKKLLDGKITTQEFTQNLAPRLGKFAAPLQQAMQKGNNALASTIFILQQTHPEFRQIMNENNN